MEKGELRQKQGFTIIEVVLVLAIAGLIFLMTFLALPALNRTQRDARRRDDISMLLRKIKDYQTNNRGALPVESEVESVVCSAPVGGTTWDRFCSDYIGDSFYDPNGESYVLSVHVCGQSNIGAECDGALADSTVFPNDFKIMIFKSATCDGSMATRSSNPRKIAAQYKLEGGGVHCANT